MMLCASYSAIGLFQKKSRWGFRIWNFQGCQRNSTWNFQGLIKKEVEFPIKKVYVSSNPLTLSVCVWIFSGIAQYG